MANSMDRLARIARRQHGLWTTAQARAAGITDQQIGRRSDQGDWIEIRNDVFCAATQPTDEVGRILAICLEIGPPVALSGAAAAFVRRFPDIGSPSTVTFLVPLSRRTGAAGCKVERSRCFPAVVPRVDGVPVLSRVDTLLTLADQVTSGVLVDCLQELTRQGDVSLDDVRTASRRGRRGSAALQQAVIALSEGGDSRPERLLHRALRAGGVPGFEFGWELLLPDGVRYQPDLWHEALGFCLEVDGLATHTKATRMDGDRIRDNRMSLLGIAVARFTASRVTREIRAVVGEVAAAVAVRSRSPQTTRGYAARRRSHRAA